VTVGHEPPATDGRTKDGGMRIDRKTMVSGTGWVCAIVATGTLLATTLRPAPAERSPEPDAALELDVIGPDDTVFDDTEAMADEDGPTISLPFRPGTVKRTTTGAELVDEGPIDPDDPFATGFLDSWADWTGDGDLPDDGGWDDVDDDWWPWSTVPTTTPTPTTTPATTVPSTTTPTTTTPTTTPTTTTTVPSSTTTTTTPPLVPSGGWCDADGTNRPRSGAVALVRQGSCLRVEAIVPRAGESLAAAVAAAQQRPGVVSAGAAHPVYLDGADPLRSEQWGLGAVPGAAAPSTAPAGTLIDVAVLDSGVDATHPDLAGVVGTGYDALATGDGRTDPNGHGTLVAGVIAAVRDNSIGIAGVTDRARIIPIRVVDSIGSGSSLDVAAGIDWAVGHGVRVINLSLGATTPDPHISAAVARAIAAGVVVVASAGNGGNVGDPANHPAADAGVIAVASVDQDLTRSSFSTRAGYVAVAAPGRGIISTYRNGTYARGSGTSFAAAHVAGAVAALLAEGATAPTVRALLQSTARDLGPAGVDDQTGAGLIDLTAARAAIPPTPSTTTTTTTTLPA